MLKLRAFSRYVCVLPARLYRHGKLWIFHCRKIANVHSYITHDSGNCIWFDVHTLPHRHASNYLGTRLRSSKLSHREVTDGGIEISLLRATNKGHMQCCNAVRAVRRQVWLAAIHEHGWRQYILHINTNHSQPARQQCYGI